MCIDTDCKYDKYRIQSSLSNTKDDQRCDMVVAMGSQDPTGKDQILSPLLNR